MKKCICILLFFISVCSINFSACKSDKTKDKTVYNDSSRIEGILYAKGFWLEQCNGYKLLHIKDPQNTNSIEYTFALRKQGTTPDIPKNIEIIDLPINRLICMTSLQLSNFIRLEATDKVVGISSTRFLTNAKMQKQLANGQTRKIGIEGDFDPEIIFSLAPDIILISPFKQGGYDAMKEVGIPLIPHLGYK